MKPKLLKTLERENEMAIPAGLAIDLSARHAGGRGFEPVSRAPFGAENGLSRLFLPSG